MTFVYLIIALYIGATAQFAYNGQWGQALYWLCAIGITVCANFLIPK